MDTNDTENQYVQSESDRISKLIRSLLEGELPRQLGDRVRMWYAEDEMREEKDRQLAEIFSQLVTEQVPDSSARKSLESLKKRLSFPDTTIHSPSLRKLRLRKLSLKIAAVILPLMLFIGGYFLYNHYDASRQSDPQAYIVVPMSESRKHLILPDGSQVWITAGSEISYNEEFLTHRSVKINGEAYFSVAKNGSPFEVVSEKLSVYVLGTQFNIRSYSDRQDAYVTLASGSVEVDVAGESYMLSAQEELYCNSSNHSVDIREVYVSELQDLRSDNIIHFDNDPLEEVFRRLSRHYGVDIITEHNFAPNNRIRVEFSGTDNLENVLSVIRLTTGKSFNYEIIDDRVLIRAN